MAYAMAWIVYLLMAALIMVAFERYLSEYLVPRQPRTFYSCVAGGGLVYAGCGCQQKPCIWCQRALRCCSICSLSLVIGLLKASLPLLVVWTTVFGVLLFRELRRTPEASA
jgi:hypothetical protein